MDVLSVDDKAVDSAAEAIADLTRPPASRSDLHKLYADKMDSTQSLPEKILIIEEGKDYFLEPGDKLPYELVQNLGHGHSGNVEAVKDIWTGTLYARKTIRYRLRDRDERRKIFDNEIKIIRNLAKHHHIIRVFATYVAKREVGLILQPVADNGDLDSFLDSLREAAEEAQDTGLSTIPQSKIDVLQRAFGCLASGLEFMHLKKIRHKDIKPHNILVHQGLVLYTDFGYSLDSSQSNHSTTEGKPSFFTRRYSSPEVLDYEARNSRSDIFSLGCVFIEMLTILESRLEISQHICFSENIDQVHLQLREAKSNTSVSFLAQLLEICISMTAREPLARSTASQVLDGIPQSPAYFCQRCLATKDGENAGAMKGFSYRLRTGIEAHRFFIVGRVFSMLHSEFGQIEFSQIRTFVIVANRRGYVYACSISTYGGRGTLWLGCNPNEYSIAFLEGAKPVLLLGEYLHNAPVAIRPASPNITMLPESRIRFAKVFKIEHNVEVRDIGMVVPEHLPELVRCWRECQVRRNLKERTGPGKPQQGIY